HDRRKRVRQIHTPQRTRARLRLVSAPSPSQAGTWLESQLGSAAPLHSVSEVGTPFTNLVVTVHSPSRLLPVGGAEIKGGGPLPPQDRIEQVVMGVQRSAEM